MSELIDALKEAREAARVAWSTADTAYRKTPEYVKADGAWNTYKALDDLYTIALAESEPDPQ